MSASTSFWLGLVVFLSISIGGLVAMAQSQAHQARNDGPPRVFIQPDNKNRGQ